MSWWQRLIGKAPQLNAELRDRISVCTGFSGPGTAGDLDAMRFVVVDVETTGLRPHRDRLISIGAVPVQEKLVHLGAGFEVVLRQDRPSANDNILIHGIDGTTQTTGRDPAEALVEFMEYARLDILVGFHAGFDRLMITRAMKRALGIELRNQWLDLAILTPELVERAAPGESTLDDWTQRFGIENPARHNAVADALVTAQLLQVTLGAAKSRGLSTAAELIEIEKAGRWLHTGR